jgi:RNA polymerase sigma-70 factor (ECF subfamily)
MLGTNAAAEEIVQGVFLKVWTSRSRLPAIASVRAFLYKATRNAAPDQLKRSAVEGRYRDELSSDETAVVEPEPDALTQLAAASPPTR